MRNRRRAEHEVGLCRVALDVQGLRRARHRCLRWRGRRIATRNVRPTGSLERLEQSIVVHVTRNRDHDVLGMVRPLVQLAEIANAER